MEKELRVISEDTNKKLPVNKLVIPFAYQSETGYEQTVSNIMKDSEGIKWQYSQLISSDHELYEHIGKLIGSADHSMGSIGDCLEIIHESNGLPFIDNRVRIEVWEQEELVGSFFVRNLQLVLFRTKLGFLILDIEYQKDITLEQITRMNYSLKGFKNRKNDYRYYKEQRIILSGTDIKDLPGEGDSYIPVQYQKSRKYIDKNTVSLPSDYLPEASKDAMLIEYQKGSYGLKYRTSCNMMDLFDLVFEPIPVITYFNNTIDKKRNKIYPRKAQVFAAVLTEQPKEDKEVESAFFCLRKGYKDSYQAGAMEYDFTNNDEIYTPFSNSFWGVSREGMANLCHLTGERTTDAFFKGNYANRLDNYFYLYLIALHQHYGLLHLTGKIAELNIEAKKCAENKKEYKAILQIRDEITFFYLKCIYDEISHISHQGKLYSMLVEVLGIKNMIHELDFEMDRIVGIISQIREEKRSKNLRLLTVAGALFTIIQVYDAILEIKGIIYQNGTLVTTDILSAGAALLITFIIGTIIWFLWRGIDKD